jgi:hypothetical protein
MLKLIQSDTFDTVFSFVLALGCMALLKPICKGSECEVVKPPPFDEVKSTTYQLGSKCYKFHMEHMECPEKGAIEPFERFIR